MKNIKTLFFFVFVYYKKWIEKIQYQKDNNFDCKDSIFGCNDAIFDYKGTNFDSKCTIFYDEDAYYYYDIDVDRIFNLKVAINILLDRNIQIKWILYHYN